MSVLNVWRCRVSFLPLLPREDHRHGKTRSCRNISMLMNDTDSGNGAPGRPLHSGFMLNLWFLKLIFRLKVPQRLFRQKLKGRQSVAARYRWGKGFCAWSRPPAPLPPHPLLWQCFDRFLTIVVDFFWKAHIFFPLITSALLTPLCDDWTCTLTNHRSDSMQ